MKTILIFGIIFLAVVAWFVLSKFLAPEGDIITKDGLHWHPSLTINILGEMQEIPENVGMVPQEMPIHTHAKDGIIHLEFAGLVRKDDVKLGKFFQIWGKQFNKDCIFDKCSGPEGNLKMLVNGKENFEFDNYMMLDNDKIEIIFEKTESASGTLKEITVVGTEFSFNPSSISVQAGEKVRIIFNNLGGTVHNLTIEGLGIGTKTIDPGKTDAIEFTSPAAGNYNFFCSIPGHKAAGMAGTLIAE